jgi:hypothetical protein
MRAEITGYGLDFPCYVWHRYCFISLAGNFHLVTLPGAQGSAWHE